MQSVLFINYEYPPVGAGGATATYHFATQFAAQGIRTTVLTSAFLDKKGVSVEDGVTLYRIPAWRRKAGQSSLLQMLAYLCSALLHLPQVIRNTQPEIAIIFFAFPCGPAGVVLRRLWNIPYIIMLRGGDVPGFEPSLDTINRLLRPVRRAVYNYSSAIVANSIGLRTLAHSSDPGFPIRVIPNGVDTAFFHPCLHSAATVPRPYTFLFAGRVCEQKNLDLLLNAFVNVQSKVRDVCLVIIGEGPELYRLQQLAKSYALEKVVVWNGWCSREVLLQHYQAADCFVIPSVNEGMSNALLEAMSCGLPALAGDCFGNREVVVSDKSGYLVALNNASELTNRMTTYAATPELSREHGRYARTWCCNQFSWRTEAEKLLAMITEILPSE